MFFELRHCPLRLYRQKIIPSKPFAGLNVYKRAKKHEFYDFDHKNCRQKRHQNFSENDLR